jgi:hypothetical protein
MGVFEAPEATSAAAAASRRLTQMAEIIILEIIILKADFLKTDALRIIVNFP